MNKSLYLSSGAISCLATLVWGYGSILPSFPTTAIAMPAPLSPATYHPSILKTINIQKTRSVAAFKYVRPKTADNGSPFPKTSGYIKGYLIQLKDGHSNITVDNSRTGSDVFVKLYALDSTPPQPARVFFIRTGEKFTTKNIKAGSYEVRYRDLNYGGFSRTDRFNVKEVKTRDGIRFSNLTLTLYKVPKGNMKIHPIQESEF